MGQTYVLLVDAIGGVRTWVSVEWRQRSGAYHAPEKELEDDDPKSFRNCIRMDKSSFCVIHWTGFPSQDKSRRLRLPSSVCLVM